MTTARAICWAPLWNAKVPGAGMEHVLLQEGRADGLVLAFDDEEGPFRLHYHLHWNPGTWQLCSADLHAQSAAGARVLTLRTDGQGCWMDAHGKPIATLDGCRDIDIWPTPFTNTFPIRRQSLTVGQRCETRVAWIGAPRLEMRAERQAYTCLDPQTYLFETLDDPSFRAHIEVDAEMIVTHYEGLFRRILAPGNPVL